MLSFIKTSLCHPNTNIKIPVFRFIHSASWGISFFTIWTEHIIHFTLVVFYLIFYFNLFFKMIWVYSLFWSLSAGSRTWKCVWESRGTLCESLTSQVSVMVYRQSTSLRSCPRFCPAHYKYIQVKEKSLQILVDLHVKCSSSQSVSLKNLPKVCPWGKNDFSCDTLEVSTLVSQSCFT